MNNNSRLRSSTAQLISDFCECVLHKALGRSTQKEMFWIHFCADFFRAFVIEPCPIFKTSLICL